MTKQFQNFKLIAKNLLNVNIHCEKCNSYFYASITEKCNIIFKNDNTPIGIKCPKCKIEEVIQE